MDKKLISTVLALWCIYVAANAQEFSQKFAHVSIPEEIEAITWNDEAPYVSSMYGIWRIDTKTWHADSVAHLKANNPFITVQGIAGVGNNLYFYINGDGIYRLQSKGLHPLLIRPSSKDFTKNIEEAYSAMNVDPTGQYLLLYGKNENVAVFDIASDMKPVVVFNDYVMDAYWVSNNLWAGCLDKVVLNRRTGRSTNNEDFLGKEDQRGMTKFYVGEMPKNTDNGETRISIGAGGEIQRLIYNKKNGDLLLCVSSMNKTNIYKMTPEAALPVASFNGWYGDFAAFGDDIIARTGSGFVEVKYGDKLTDVNPHPIVTDIFEPPMWKGQKPRPYKITGSFVMDFDKNGNLWIAKNRDLFVKFNH